MLEYIKQETNLTMTENGATTYLSAGSECLDLFATIGALRRESDEEIITRFIRAYTENADLAMKLLFFARDIRGGLGERRVFRTILSCLAFNEPDSVEKNIAYIAEYGRFDDLLVLLGTPCEKSMLSYLKEQFEKDLAKLEMGEAISLLGKWLPSVNASNANTVKNAKKLARVFGLNDAQYRKSVSMLRAKIQILENNLREKDYSFLMKSNHPGLCSNIERHLYEMIMKDTEHLFPMCHLGQQSFMQIMFLHMNLWNHI